jgi:hypothetical protein
MELEWRWRKKFRILGTLIEIIWVKPMILLNFQLNIIIWSIIALLTIYIIISVFCVCVCVWHSIGLAPGRDTNLRMVSLEPSRPEPAIFEKNFPEKWPVAKSRGKSLRLQYFSMQKFSAFCFHFWKAFFSKY